MILPYEAVEAAESILKRILLTCLSVFDIIISIIIRKVINMGMFFSNLHIRKNGSFTAADIAETLTAEMQAKGCTKLDSAENSELELAVYAPESSEWISAVSEFYNFYDDKDTSAVAAPLSDKYGTYIIAAACVDSDFAFMHLLNTSNRTDGWINSGTPYEGVKLPRRTSTAPWKNAVRDFEKFKAVIKEQYTYAEEVFYNCAELLCMTTEQFTLEPGVTEGLDEKYLIRLYFRLPEGTEKKLPKLEIDTFSLMPCNERENQVVFVNNKGGRSKGIGIKFTGDWIENDDVEIYDATFESNCGSDKRSCVPISFTKKKDDTGKSILWWQDEKFLIPPAVNPDLPWSKKSKLEFEKQFGIRFWVKGNKRKFLDIKVFIIPLENYEKGYDCWYVYRRARTKYRYIEEMNKPKLEEIRSLEMMSGVPEDQKQKAIEAIKQTIIDPDKYDLD